MQRHWTIRELAERSGVSVRFLVQLESGRANISVKRLADLARAFNVPTADLLAEDHPDAPRMIALLGLRGAGKTTIGKQLARQLHVRFLELDKQIEKAADMSLAELFALYGEDYYRRLERETLAQVLRSDLSENEIASHVAISAACHCDREGEPAALEILRTAVGLWLTQAKRKPTARLAALITWMMFCLLQRGRRSTSA